MLFLIAPDPLCSLSSLCGACINTEPAAHSTAGEEQPWRRFLSRRRSVQAACLIHIFHLDAWFLSYVARCQFEVEARFQIGKMARISSRDSSVVSDVELNNVLEEGVRFPSGPQPRLSKQDLVLLTLA